MATKHYEVLRDYLERNRVVGPNSDWNITGMGKHDKGSYRIPDKDYDKFLKLVHDTIFGDHPTACGLLEKHLPTGGPVLIDLDFKYTAGSHLQRRFDDAQLRTFVLNYASAIYRYFDIKPLDKPLRFFVLLKPAPEVAPAKNKDLHIHKDGVHIICPDLTLDPKIQYTLRGYMLQKNIVQSVFDETGFTNAEQDVFDIAVINRNNWFLYGATKPDKAWYSVSAMYEIPTDLDLGALGEDARCAAIDEAIVEGDLDEFTDLDYTKLFSIRIGHEVVTPLKVVDDRKFEWEALYNKWAGGKNTSINSPIALQIVDDDDVQEEAFDVAQAPTQNTLEQEDYDWGELSGGYTNEDIEQACELVEKCLNPNKRARDYGSWIDTGLCLYNINSSARTPQDDKMCKRWATFSRRADGYEHVGDDVYEKAWRGFHKETTAKKIRIGSLHFWADEDNPAKYKEVTERTAVGWVIQNPEGTHGKVADLMKRMYKHVFCATIMGRKNQEYFQYAGNYWKKLKSNNELWIRLTRNIERLYSGAIMECARLAYVAGEPVNKDNALKKDSMDEQQKKQGAMQEKNKILLKTKAQLESTPFLENVLKMCFQKFYNDNFTDMLNQKKDIFACGNCVVELRHYDGAEIRPGDTPRVYIRKGRPDDFISFVMGRENELDAITLDYDQKTGKMMPFDPNTPEQLELSKFFKLVFPRDDLREYVLTLLAACLEGENREQKFYILRGGGSNGKSKLLNLMSFVFGEYQTSLNTAALTRKRPESGAANPDIITLKSKRFIFMQEPDEGEKLNTARIKQFTGGDIVEARALFGDQEKFKIMGRIFFSTNDLPPVNSMDGGTWRRMEVLPFESTFKPHGHPEIDPSKHIYEQDTNLDDKFKQTSMRIAFLRLLLHYWETKYLVDGLSMPPDCVMEAVNKFKAENDSFVAFANETFIKEPGAVSSITDIIPRYNMWMSLQPGRKKLKKPEIIERLAKMFKSADGGITYKDVRIACEGEDISGNYLGGGGFR